MKLVLSDGINDVFEEMIEISSKRFKYYFRIEGHDETIYYTSDGILTKKPEKKNCFYLPCVNIDDIYRMPEWAEGKTIYQIWTDRFFNGDKDNDPENVSEWGELPDRGTMYGGDFKGISEKLPYLKDLGISVIYLNPVFVSPSYHKYDISDYESIEDCFGGVDELKNMIDQAHGYDIRVILDGVLNHCSDKHPFFQDVIKHGKNSKYHRWFLPETFPIQVVNRNYDTFAGLVAEMPRFATWEEEVINYLVENTVMWTKKLNIDGWRLDVCDEVSHSLLKQLRKRLVETKDDILIIGEIWNHASRWMLGDEVHTVTNYKYRQSMMEWLSGEIDGITFWNALNRNKMHYKTMAYNYLVNVNSTHDTERIRFFLKDDESLALCAMAILFSLDGMPLLYYGDELFMDGDTDPDCRRAMNWQDINSGFAEQVRKLSSYRACSNTLQTGGIQLFQAKEQLVSFLRVSDDEKLLCIINPGDNQTISAQHATLILGEGSSNDGVLMIPEKSWSIWSLCD
jgi:glycosidase